jgi:hypothetical protein
LAFQTSAGFDCQVCLELLDRGFDPHFRLFGYNTLKVVIETSWADLPDDTQRLLCDSFPFHDADARDDANQISLFSPAVAMFLAYAADADDIHIFFAQFIPEHRRYYAMILALFLSQIFHPTYLDGRTLVMLPLVLDAPAPAVGYVKEIVMLQLARSDFGSPEFDFFLNCATVIHGSAPLVANQLVSDPEADLIYETLARLLWEPSEFGQLASVFEAVFKSEPESLEHLLCKPKFHYSAEFELCFLSHRILLVQICTILCEISFSDYPCCAFDHQWSDYGLRLAIFRLAGSLLCYDNGYLLGDLMHSILVDGIDSFAFSGIVKILSHTLKRPSNQLVEAFREDAFLLTQNLILSFRHVPDHLQDTVAKVLGFLVPYLMLDEPQASSLLDDTISRVLSSQIAVPGRFRSFLSDFLCKFSGRLTVSPEQVSAISSVNPCYEMTASLLVNGSTPSEDSLTPITDSLLETILTELRWFAECFSPADVMSRQRAFGQFQHALTPIMNLEKQVISIHPARDEIAHLMIYCNNAMIRLTTDVSWTTYANQGLKLVFAFCPKFAYFATLNPHGYLAKLRELEFPAVIDPLTDLWLSRLVVPTLWHLVTFDLEIVQIYTKGRFELVGEPIMDRCIAEKSMKEKGIGSRMIRLLTRLALLLPPEPAMGFVGRLLDRESLKFFKWIRPVIEANGFEFLAELWPLIMAREQAFLIEVSGLLFEMDKRINDIAVFARLPGVDPAAVAELQAESTMPGNLSAKSRRRLFKLFVIRLRSSES